MRINVERYMFKMIDVLDRLEYFAETAPDRLAFKSVNGQISYRQLWEESKALSSKLEALRLEGKIDVKSPIAVYGHKEPQMIIAFLGCALAGHPYCPLDKSMPDSRIEDILGTIGTGIWIKCEDGEAKILELTSDNLDESSAFSGVCADDVMYIIFTSGSTGKPKGVEVTKQNLGNFLEWMTGVGTPIEEKEGAVFLNQAPYSFDLSVMDTYTALASGATIASLDKGTMLSAASTMEFLKVQNINYWVSTPSFVDMMLVEKLFNAENYPGIKVFFFCGERLTKTTASKLMIAFPNSKIINTYGPTESTVAISSVEIKDNYINEDDELPVGIIKPGTKVFLQKEDGIIIDEFNQNITEESAGREDAAPQKTDMGEILIEGNTVAKGYFKMPEKTAAAFDLMEFKNEEVRRMYHTGDLGYFKNGMLYCIGRTDLQVKVHGYRMEIGDIEANIMLKENVEAVCVVPKRKDGKIRSLVAFVVAPSVSGSFDDAKDIKRHLKELLPEYMVPKKIKFIDKLPMTLNGKVDRKTLEGMA